MSNNGLAESLGIIPALKRTHEPTAAPCAGALDHRLRQRGHVGEIERESAEWIAEEGVEPGGKEHQLGGPATRDVVDGV